MQNPPAPFIAYLLVAAVWLVLHSEAVGTQAITNSLPRGAKQRGKGGRNERAASPQDQGQRGSPATAFRTQVPAHPVDVILGRPTRNSVTLSVLAYEDRQGYVAYGLKTGQLTNQTLLSTFPRGQPVALVLGSLGANMRYYYELRSRTGANGPFARHPEGTFHTARSAGSRFTFTMTADPHLDEATEPAVYERSLASVLAARPDFHLDLGDTFMTDKYAQFKEAHAQYLAQRYYFGLIGHSAPVFLVLGNHDGEGPAKGGSGPDSMSVWSNVMRKRYFPNPVPDPFYTGNQTVHPHAGLLQNYYAWEWGDALFLVLDPFWYSNRPRGGERDNWGRTLGAEQYQWLTRTLETSRARFRFVFLHHLVGGETKEGRGGAEAARFFEWGGKSLDGREEFEQKRPGWLRPIHQLLVNTKVSAVFHGHDHLYVKQDLDGTVYQEVPQPGHPKGGTRSAAEYGYRSGVILGSSGILRVTVSPETATVDYVKTDPAPARPGVVAHSYSIRPR